MPGHGFGVALVEAEQVPPDCGIEVARLHVVRQIGFLRPRRPPVERAPGHPSPFTAAPTRVPIVPGPYEAAPRRFFIAHSCTRFLAPPLSGHRSGPRLAHRVVAVVRVREGIRARVPAATGTRAVIGPEVARKFRSTPARSAVPGSTELSPALGGTAPPILPGGDLLARAGNGQVFTGTFGTLDAVARTVAARTGVRVHAETFRGHVPTGPGVLIGAAVDIRCVRVPRVLAGPGGATRTRIRVTALRARGIGRGGPTIALEMPEDVVRRRAGVTFAAVIGTGTVQEGVRAATRPQLVLPPAIIPIAAEPALLGVVRPEPATPREVVTIPPETTPAGILAVPPEATPLVGVVPPETTTTRRIVTIAPETALPPGIIAPETTTTR